MSKPVLTASESAPFLIPAQFRFLRMPEVLTRRGRSRSSHYADIQAGLFPRPVSIGSRAVAHPDYEVDAMNAATVAGLPEDQLRRLVQRIETARRGTR